MADGNLNFSNPITLTCGQTMSVVVDGIGEKNNPKIGNYGLILVGYDTIAKWEKPSPNYQMGPVTEDPETDSQALINEGYTLINKNENYFTVKRRLENLDEKRDFETVFEGHSEQGQPKEATTILTEPCASVLDKIFSFTVKTFPNFGAYGFVNYDLGARASIQFGRDLNIAR